MNSCSGWVFARPSTPPILTLIVTRGTGFGAGLGGGGIRSLSAIVGGGALGAFGGSLMSTMVGQR